MRDVVVHDDWRDDSGSVEAGLVLIPTTIFFLLILQLIVAGSAKTLETMQLQSRLNQGALYASNQLKSDQISSWDLPGGGEVLTVKTKTDVANIGQLLGNFFHSSKLQVSNYAIAVRE